MRSAEKQLRRALMALRLEVDGTIVDSVTVYVDAAMAEARREALLEAEALLDGTASADAMGGSEAQAWLYRMADEIRALAARDGKEGK